MCAAALRTVLLASVSLRVAVPSARVWCSRKLRTVWLSHAARVDIGRAASASASRARASASPDGPVNGSPRPGSKVPASSQVRTSSEVRVCAGSEFSASGISRGRVARVSTSRGANASPVMTGAGNLHRNRSRLVFAGSCLSAGMSVTTLGRALGSPGFANWSSPSDRATVAICAPGEEGCRAGGADAPAQSDEPR